MSLEEDLSACAKLVSEGDPERFACLMASPLAARRVLLPIYAFNLEVSRAPWMTKEPLIAHMRLQWWADVLDEIIAGGFVRRHEVVTPLAMVLDAGSAAMLQPLVEARRRDVEQRPFETEDALVSYCAQTGGALMATASVALGATQSYGAKALGTATAIATYLQAVPELRMRGKAPLPSDDWDGITRLAQTGLDYLAQARSVRSQQAKAACLPGWIADLVLKAAVGDPKRVERGHLMPSLFRQNARRLYVAKTGRW